MKKIDLIRAGFVAAQADRLWAEARRLWAKARRLWVEADRLWAEARRLCGFSIFTYGTLREIAREKD